MEETSAGPAIAAILGRVIQQQSDNFKDKISKDNNS